MKDILFYARRQIDELNPKDDVSISDSTIRTIPRHSHSSPTLVKLEEAVPDSNAPTSAAPPSQHRGVKLETVTSDDDGEDEDVPRCISTQDEHGSLNSNAVESASESFLLLHKVIQDSQERQEELQKENHQMAKGMMEMIQKDPKRTAK